MKTFIIVLLIIVVVLALLALDDAEADPRLRAPETDGRTE
jgi:hypothetical protein